MVVVIGKITLNVKKNLVIELKKKVIGINYTLAKKISMLSGCLEKVRGINLTDIQEQRIVELVKNYKGLVEYNYNTKSNFFEKIRRIENPYRYLRYKKGYPVSQRTRTNAKTAAKVKVVKVALKKVTSVNKKPVTKKEKKLYNKIKRMVTKITKTKKKNDKKKKS